MCGCMCIACSLKLLSRAFPRIRKIPAYRRRGPVSLFACPSSGGLPAYAAPLTSDEDGDLRWGSKAGTSNAYQLMLICPV